MNLNLGLEYYCMSRTEFIRKNISKAVCCYGQFWIKKGAKRIGSIIEGWKFRDFGRERVRFCLENMSSKFALFPDLWLNSAHFCWNLKGFLLWSFGFIFKKILSSTMKYFASFQFKIVPCVKEGGSCSLLQRRCPKRVSLENFFFELKRTRDQG